ncbi:putative ribonuclease H-like domain-containing protein [Tanacetum coccineum]
MVPRAVLMKSGLVSLNTARQVNTAHPKITMNSARPMTNLSKSAHSTVKWPIHKNTTFKNSNFNQRVNTVKDKKFNTARPKEVVNAARPKAVVNAVKGNNVNVVKASACWVWKPKTKVLDHGNPQIDLQDKGVIDSGCSRHMTGNMSYLTDYEEIDGGYVAFGGNPKGGKIIGKVKEGGDSQVTESIKLRKGILNDCKQAPRSSVSCARYQVNSKVSHLHAVKRIFRYLKGQPKLGLWYPKDSPFNLVAYTDSDYAGASLDRKSTTGAYASFKDFMVYQMDVKSAFLYGKIEEEVYVCQPPGFEDPDFPDRVYKVEKALYGLHQAPRAWYETLSTYLLDNGFHRGKIDKTFFIRRDKGDILLVQVYVDDIIFGSTKKSLCTEFEKMMHKKF